MRRLYWSPLLFFFCFFSLTYGSRGQAWGINRRSHLEAPCYFCQHAFTLRQWVWWWPDGWAIHDRFGIGGRRGQSVGWKRCLLHNCAGYLSASIEWRRCDISGQAVPEMRQIQTHSSQWDQAVWVVYISPCVSVGRLPCVMSLSRLLEAYFPFYIYRRVSDLNIDFYYRLIVVCSCSPIPTDLCNRLKGTL